MFDVPNVFLPAIMQAHARARPDKPALVCETDRLSWGELERRMTAFARFLRSRRIGRGHRVAVLAEPTAAAIVAQFGAIKAGACVASLSGMVSGASLLRMIVDSEASVLVADAHFRSRIEALADDLPPGQLHAMVLLDACAEGWLSMADTASDEAAGEAEPYVRIERDDEYVLLYSSGTTGVPKGIVLSHGCRLANSYLMAVEKRYDGDAVVLSSTALYSNTTWTLLTLAFFTGGTAVVMRKFDAQGAIALIERERVSHTVMVPAQLRMILDAPEQAAADLTSIRTLCTTGSAMPVELKRRAAARFPNAYYEVYGLTEGLVLVLKPEDLEAHLDSVGKPMLGNDIRIVDDDGVEVPHGGKGEIVGYGPLLMRGYNKRPDATAEAIWREPASGRTFLRSGDIGHFDADGYLHLAGRKKDMLVSGGYNVYPADIETVIAAHPAVVEASVIGVPHEKWGETPFAYLVGKPGPRPALPDLLAWINARVGKHERLAGIDWIEALPRNAGGKIVKRDLLGRFMETARQPHREPAS